MTESEVRKLLRQMKELDSQTAFRNFYNMTYDRLFRIAYYYVKQEEWSQEIVLDVFLKLWKQRSNLLDVRNIEDYCFILVKNASLNYLEKELKHTYIHPDSLPEPQEQSYSPEESLISEELFALYVKALDRLPERCREVFIRIREEKQSYAHIFMIQSVLFPFNSCWRLGTDIIGDTVHSFHLINNIIRYLTHKFIR